MWRSWGKSTVRIHNTSSSSSSSSSPSSSFSCSSFKDIQSLCLDEPPQPSSCRAATVFHRVRFANSLLRTWSAQHQHQPRLPKPVSHPAPNSDAAVSDPPTRTLTVQTDTPPTPPPPPPINIPGAEQRIVVYYTSLRVVRSTFEDCRSVRLILRGFRVKMDERDVSMDVGYMRELKSILVGEKKVTLPRVFIGGRYIGGAEEVRQLNEIGELKKIVEGLPAADLGACDVCGGYRFILCEECNGSRKIYTEKTGLKTCTVCNENGLIRCPSCCCPVPLCVNHADHQTW